MHSITFGEMCKRFNSFFSGRYRKIQSLLGLFFTKRNQYNFDGKCYDRIKKKCKYNGY